MTLSHSTKDVIINDISTQYKKYSTYEQLSKEEKRVLAFQSGFGKCLRYRVNHHKNCFRSLIPKDEESKYKKIADEDHVPTLEILDTIVSSCKKTVSNIKKRKELIKPKKASHPKYIIKSGKRRTSSKRK